MANVLFNTYEKLLEVLIYQKQVVQGIRHS